MYAMANIILPGFELQMFYAQYADRLKDKILNVAVLCRTSLY